MRSERLKGKNILAVDDEPDVLETIRDELGDYGVQLDGAGSYEEGMGKLSAYKYDLIILDIMGVRGFELLVYAVARKIPTVMLTAHALSPQALRTSIELGARAYLPKDQLGQLAPFLDDVICLTHQSAWKSLFLRLGGAFGTRFGPAWRTSEEEFWDKFEQEMGVNEAAILQS